MTWRSIVSFSKVTHASMALPSIVPRLTVQLLLLILGASSLLGALRPYDLKCDDMVNPLGVDSDKPCFSWRLDADGKRGARQLAWRILAASSLDRLAANDPDLWDSGRVPGPEQSGIHYRGKPLNSSQRVFWKLCVWDENGIPSAWSSPAEWTMGLLSPKDWQASWISDAELLRMERSHLGFHSKCTRDPQTRKWLVLDLGEEKPIDEVVLHALRHSVPDGYGFPLRFKLEIATAADFSDAKVILDRSQADVDWWVTSHRATAGGTTARYVRLYTTKLRTEDDGTCRLALSQIEIISHGKNIAPTAKVSASDSVEDPTWDAQAVVDGLGVSRTNPRASDTLLLIKPFQLKKPLRRAIAYICGLGYYTLEINGRRIGEDYMTPPWTQYSKRCFYDSIDVTSALNARDNALGVTLAGGMFNVQSVGRYSKFTTLYRPLRLIAQLRLEYEDGSLETLATDSSWKVKPGPTTLAQMFGGEDCDARQKPWGWTASGFDDSTWSTATEIQSPGGVLSGSSLASPPLRIAETLPVSSIRTFSPKHSVYDFGQNASMTIRLTVRGPRGARVKITPAELIDAKGHIDRSSCGSGESSWNYTLAGSGDLETWTPQFFYHGFRYLKVELDSPGGLPLPDVKSLEALVVHSSSEAVGDFSCSNELMNRIRLLVRWAQRSNAMSVFTDCPHRERLGWIEQYYLNGPSLRYEYDFSRLFRKGINDMSDGQTEQGLIPSINPEYVVFTSGFRDSPEWGSAFILSSLQQFEWTGDTAVLAAHFEGMKRYVAYLGKRASGHILSHGLGDWYDLGPKRPGVAQLTPIGLSATALYYASADALARIADRLGYTDDAREHRLLAQEIKKAFNERFLDRSKGSYATGSQTSNSLPLALGIVPEEFRAAVLASLLADIRAKGNTFTTGDIGYRFLLRALAEEGRSDVILAMNNQSDRPGYGYQLAQGCSSLAESWQADRHSSYNHFMLGQITEWFYADLAGLAPDPSVPGWKRILIHPNPVDGIDWARASYKSPYGRVSVSWRKTRSGIVLDACVPANTVAEIRLPCANASDVRESGLPLSQSDHLRVLRSVPGFVFIEVDSGNYCLESPLSTGTSPSIK
jgi:hypothetical protein